jgi:hypothetical protein
MIPAILKAMEVINENASQSIEYPEEGGAQIAETTCDGRRLIVRCTRLVGPQAQLWPDWRQFAFVTNRTEDITIVEVEHRDHAVIEQVIADLKAQAFVHFPSGEFNANGAWTVLGALAHNLLGGLSRPGTPLRHGLKGFRFEELDVVGFGSYALFCGASVKRFAGCLARVSVCEDRDRE